MLVCVCVCVWGAEVSFHCEFDYKLKHKTVIYIQPVGTAQQILMKHHMIMYLYTLVLSTFDVWDKTSCWNMLRSCYERMFTVLVRWCCLWCQWSLSLIMWGSWGFVTANVRKPLVYPLPCIQVKLMLIFIIIFFFF